MSVHVPSADENLDIPVGKRPVEFGLAQHRVGPGAALQEVARSRLLHRDQVEHLRRQQRLPRKAVHAAVRSGRVAHYGVFRKAALDLRPWRGLLDSVGVQVAIRRAAASAQPAH